VGYEREGGNEEKKTDQVLGRKDRVHDGDVGRGKVRGDGEDEEAGDGRVATELKTVDIWGRRVRTRTYREEENDAQQRALAMAGTRAGGSGEGG